MATITILLALVARQPQFGACCALCSIFFSTQFVSWIHTYGYYFLYATAKKYRERKSTHTAHWIYLRNAKFNQSCAVSGHSSPPFSGNRECWVAYKHITHSTTIPKQDKTKTKIIIIKQRKFDSKEIHQRRQYFPTDPIRYLILANFAIRHQLHHGRLEYVFLSPFIYYLKFDMIPICYLNRRLVSRFGRGIQ